VVGPARTVKLVREAVTEGKGTAAVECIAAMKKSGMAAHAAELLKRTGGLPAMLRAG
jgi:hypothetical protein